MKYRVRFAPRAEDQLAELLLYIGSAASPDIAERYVDAIIEQCENLETFPFRGTARDDIRPGLRVLGFRRRVAIAFEVTDSDVIILGIFYGGKSLNFNPEDSTD